MRFYAMLPYDDFIFGYDFAYGEKEEPIRILDPGGAGTCPVCEGVLGTRRWGAPHYISLSCRKYPDVLWGAGFTVMFSVELVDLWRGAGLREPVSFAEPASVLKVRRRPVEKLVEPPPQYCNVEVRCDGALLDEEASGARRNRAPDCFYCRQGIDAVERIAFVQGSWTGQDVFEALGLPGTLIVTERVLNLFERYNIKGVDLVAAEDYYFDLNKPVRYGKRTYRRVYPPG
jgi:hypothetical protein